MKKICVILFVSISMLSAKIYVGGQVGASYMNPHVKVKGRDYLPNSNSNTSFNFKKSFPMKTLTFGALSGYEFDTINLFSPFVEADYNYMKKSKEFTQLDYNTDVNALSDENLKVQQHYSVGVMPGINIKITDSFSVVVGSRFNITKYTVTASHVSANGSIGAWNYKSKNAFAFGVEPTLGAAFKVSKFATFRLSAGYNITRQVKVISDYANNPLFKEDGVSASVTIRPRGFNLRAAVIVGF